MSYSAPGRIDELDAARLAAWNEELSAIFVRQVAAATAEAGLASDRAWLFDPIADGIDGTAEATISWTAFPKRIAEEAATPRAAWQRADADRDEQEEYCEWEVLRDGANKVVRVTFTCETEDYYGFLAGSAPDLLLDLYRTHVSAEVALDDLVVRGSYRPQNRWNYPQNGGARGALMHMAQRNNSFEAAVNLTAVASWPRVGDDDQPITGEQALIACRPFGDERRHSDPHIGAEINALVRAGNEVSFADPVGLYIDSVDQTDWETPDGSDPAEWYRVVRGADGHMLRLTFEAPTAGHALGDVRIGGERLEYGGQIAEKLQIRVRGIARPADAQAPRLRCRRPGAGPEVLGLEAVEAGPARSRLPAR